MTRFRRGLTRLSQWADFVIGLLKWPVAVVALVVLPKAALAFLGVLRDVVSHPASVFPLLLGLAAYFALWRLLLRRRAFGTFFSTLEHELTHALFALLTFHPVTGLSATWGRGGRMSFRGKGNWLITVAPYFFPTAAAVVLAATWLVPEEWRAVAGGLLGATVGYHLTSTLRETHSGQSDLQLVGLMFSVMFLPAANLVALGIILSTAIGGDDRALEFLQALK